MSLSAFIGKLARALLLVGLLAATTLQGQEQVSTTADPDREAEVEACKDNLNMIYQAVAEFRRKHGRLPDWLSELHPEFIHDGRLFICPRVYSRIRLRGEQFPRNEVLSDPLLPISYGYEFCMKDYPLWAGYSTTVREYKNRQMKVLGPEVPILRCFAHWPYLNLTYGGRFFDSGLEWEEQFTNNGGYAQLFPVAAFAKDFVPVAGHPTSPVSPRDLSAPVGCVDLSHFYHSPLDKPWVWGNPKGNDLANLPQGIVQLGRVTFDVRGVIQLWGRGLYAPFPVRVERIPVGQLAHRIHFLMGTFFPETPGTTIGHYQIHYADRSLSLVPIVYGHDVWHWWFDAKNRPTTTAKLAWEGTSAGSDAVGQRVWLFDLKWENTYPEIGIESIDFVSGNTDSAPFLIAITVE